MTNPCRKAATTAEEVLPPSKPGVPPGGSYRVYSENESGFARASTAAFWVKGDSIYGTILDPGGDYGLQARQHSRADHSLYRLAGVDARA